jgi:hypothetical protein
LGGEIPSGDLGSDIPLKELFVGVFVLEEGALEGILVGAPEG